MRVVERTRTAGQGDMRGDLLREATKQFGARGFDGTSLQDIAKAVGIRKPSLLYHFASKEDLRLAVLDQVLARWTDLLPRLLLATAGGEQRFETLIREAIGFFHEDPDRARLLVREILDRPDDMRRRLESHVRTWVDVVAEYIRKGQKSGEIYEEVDPEAYILQTINMVVSGVAAVACLDGGLLPKKDPRGNPAARHTRELVRIARVSLFVSPEGEPRKTPAKSTRDGEKARRGETR